MRVHFGKDASRKEAPKEIPYEVSDIVKGAQEVLVIFIKVSLKLMPPKIAGDGKEASSREDVEEQAANKRVSSSFNVLLHWEETLGSQTLSFSLIWVQMRTDRVPECVKMADFL